MFTLFEGATADEVWRKAAASLAGSDAVTAASRCGNTREILHAGVSVSDPRQRWVFSREPALNPAFAIAEVIWVLSGREDSAFLNFFNSRLPQYAGTGDTYAGAYGQRLRHHFGLDQLKRACSALQGNPESRQVVLQIWSPKADFPREAGEPASRDVPCNLVSMLKVRDGKLEWTQIMRSNDIFLGLPHDLLQFTSLQEIMAGWLGLELGSYNQVSDSLHVYEEDVPSLLEVDDVSHLENSDSIALPMADSEAAIVRIAGQVDEIIAGRVSQGDIVHMAAAEDIPSAFRNLRSIVLAEAVRKLGGHVEAEEIAAVNTNPALAFLWRRWSERVASNRRV